MAETDPFLENPCKTACAYGTCRQTWADPYGCGGCCGCLGGCRVEDELEQAMIPETREQARERRHWEAVAKVAIPRGGPFPL